MSDENKTPTWIIWDTRTEEIMRVVQCKYSMVTMSGHWSNQWEFEQWIVPSKRNDKPKPERKTPDPLDDYDERS